MSKHLEMTCPACGYEDFKWSEEQDENVSKEKPIIYFEKIIDQSTSALYDMYGCPKCNTIFFD